MDKTIYLVRHGQTEWNLEERLQGWSDSPLTSYGVQRAIALHKELQSTPIDCIYSSDLQRAYETAKLLRGDRQIPIFKRSELRELALGPWEGRLFEEVQQEDPKRLDIYFNQPEDHYFPNVEDYHDLMDRIGKFIEELKEAPYSHVLVVGHGVSIAAIMNIIYEIPLKEFWNRPLVDGLSISLIKYKGSDFQVIQEGVRVKGSSY